MPLPLIVIDMLTLIGIVHIGYTQLIYSAHPRNILISLSRHYFKRTIIVLVCWAALKFNWFPIVHHCWLLHCGWLDFEGVEIVFVAWTSLELTPVFVLGMFVPHQLWDRYLVKLWFVWRLTLKFDWRSVARIAHFYSAAACRLFLYVFNLKRFELGFVWGVWDKRLRFKHLSLDKNVCTPMEPILDMETAGSSTRTGMNVYL